MSALNFNVFGILCDNYDTVFFLHVTMHYTLKHNEMYRQFWLHKLRTGLHAEYCFTY